MKMFLFCLVLYISYRIAKTYSSQRDATGHIEADWLENENLPHELKKAQIYMNETEIKDAHGKKLRVDQVFLTECNQLIVVDTKTRSSHSVYKNDIEQVSRYAIALNQSETYRVSDYCYIRTVIISGILKFVHYHRVKVRGSIG